VIGQFIASDPIAFCLWPEWTNHDRHFNRRLTDVGEIGPKKIYRQPLEYLLAEFVTRV